MAADNYLILEHLLIALAAGGVIGFERSFHGRPAGFRTHTLVCVASSALMLVTIYQGQWYPDAFAGRVVLDPTRMAQGIMTGIGFLGAGVIFKEGLTVRGLTTAASIWVTAAIGILAGIGFYFPLAVTTLLTVLTLSVFRWIEIKMPGEFYAQLQVRFPREAVMPEDEFRKFLADHRFSVANLSYFYSVDAKSFEYKMVIRTREAANARRLQESLRTTVAVQEFRMSPAGD
ncbi:MAG: MgtC/SapB family protein [Gammaproteobacteria bacterium]|nr:MgtC/SapB family protein [Gammaproteobacteria bacterium]